MAEEFTRLEVSLKEYISDAQSDAHNAKNVNAYRYNNLRIYMDSKRFSSPHFFVRIGISEAAYDLSSGERISGGLGQDERYIVRWLNRFSVRETLNSAWSSAKKTSVIKLDEQSEE